MTTEQHELIKAARANALPRVVRLLASGVNPNRGQVITPASCEVWLRKVADRGLGGFAQGAALE